MQAIPYMYLHIGEILTKTFILMSRCTRPIIHLTCFSYYSSNEMHFKISFHSTSQRGFSIRFSKVGKNRQFEVSLHSTSHASGIRLFTFLQKKTI